MILWFFVDIIVLVLVFVTFVIVLDVMDGVISFELMGSDAMKEHLKLGRGGWGGHCHK